MTDHSRDARHGMTVDPFWDNRFHWCALAAGFLAAGEGWLHDSERVRRLAYEWYEKGAFRDHEVAVNQTPLPDSG